VVGHNSSAVQVLVFPGNGDGTFQTAVVSAIVPSAYNGYADIVSPTQVGDINGDGKTDLALCDIQNSAVYILFGNNTGSFTLGNTLPTYSNPDISNQAYLLDLNGDGKLDLLVTDNVGAEFMVFLGNGGPLHRGQRSRSFFVGRRQRRWPSGCHCGLLRA
jgi:FG-GAP-like repeat